MRNLLLSALFLLVLLSASTGSIAQNIASPYSIIGIGDLDNSYYNRNTGMANTGLSLRSNHSLYQANPASFSALDNQFFTFETALLGKTVTYKGQGVDPGENSNGDFTVKKIAAGVKLTPRLGTAIGFTPFSSVNYTFATNKNIPGTGFSVYDGNGGINQLFLGNAYRISKNFSIGINTAYLFGSLKQTENIVDPTSQSSIASTTDVYYRKFNFTYGLQYFTAITKKLNYNIGFIFSPENTLKGERSLLVVNNGTEVIRNEVLSDARFTFPTTFGVGMSITRNKNLTLAADYKYQGWSSTNYRSNSASYVNSHRYSIGVDYGKLKSTRDFTYERFNLQAGVFYSDSYLKINGRQLKEYGFTLGGGIPISGGKINLNVALEAGSRGTTQNNLIKESYGQITFNISYRDFWYTRGRRYD